MKKAGLQDKTSKFSFCPAKNFSLSDKSPVNLSKENNILTTKMPTVLQILILSCKRFQTVCFARTAPVEWIKNKNGRVVFPETVPFYLYKKLRSYIPGNMH